MRGVGRRSRPSIRSIRRATRPRSIRSVSATSAGGRAVDEHREQRQVVGLDAVRGGVELRARERRERRGAARDAPDRLEQLVRRGRLVDEPVGAGHAGEHLDLVAGGAV